MSNTLSVLNDVPPGLGYPDSQARRLGEFWRGVEDCVQGLIETVSRRCGVRWHCHWKFQSDGCIPERMAYTPFPNIHTMSPRRRMMHRVKKIICWAIALPFVLAVLYELFGYNSAFNMHL
jgi:hypothetical protein